MHAFPKEADEMSKFGIVLLHSIVLGMTYS